jgi:hypothetical protein
LPTPSAVPVEISTPVSQPSPVAASVIFTPTPTPVMIAQDPPVSPSPQPLPTSLPPITPLTIFTPARCLILALVGLVVFTVTYGIQVALWWRRQK